ncbi:MAG TPA: cyclase family protein [Geobacteraceae bacterium]
MKIIDISVAISEELPVYPGDPPVTCERFGSLERGDPANVTRLVMTTHTGTHLDAGRHLAADGETVDRIALSLLMGRAVVVELPGIREISAYQLHRLPLKGYKRVLLKTDNSKLWSRPGFVPDYAHLTADGAEYLLAAGVRLVGIDYLSVERWEGDGALHRQLLGGGAVILEGLDLSAVTPGEYELICLPLKVRDGDGAPARAVLRGAAGGEAGRTVDPHSSRWPLA